MFIVVVVLMTIAEKEGSQNGGWGGLAILALLFGCGIAVTGLIVGMVVWTIDFDIIENKLGDRAKKVIAIILLIICGTIICGGLRGLVESPLLTVIKIRPDAKSYIIWYVQTTLVDAIIPAIPIGFGAAALMRIYSREYSLKAPLFMLCAFLPTQLIAGGMLVKQYFSDEENYFYHHEFTDPLDAVIFTALVAVFAAVIYAVTAFIRGRRHCY